MNAVSKSNVCFTLPITCQICLGKVKEPAVCPNLHVFCSFCIEIWLEKSKQCPTCRIPITNETPCKRILGGGCDSKDDLLIPTDFAHSSTRKARVYSLFQQYEDEISRLLKQIEILTNDVALLKELNNSSVPQYDVKVGDSDEISNAQHGLINMLKNKIKQIQFDYNELNKENEKLKEVYIYFSSRQYIWSSSWGAIVVVGYPPLKKVFNTQLSILKLFEKILRKYSRKKNNQIFGLSLVNRLMVD
jgi:hypothetical protein